MTEAQDQTERRQTGIDIAVLKEQVNTLGREMGELKRVNASQSDKLDLVLTQLSEAKGGLRTMLWFGGAMSGVGAVFVWVIQHLIGKP